MNEYSVIIYKEGVLLPICENEPLKLNFTSYFKGVMALTKLHSENLTKALTIKMKRI